MSTIPDLPVELSGRRLWAYYALAAADRAEAEAVAWHTCVEQTVEFPADLLPPAGDIRQGVVGRLEALDEAEPRRWLAAISYAVENLGGSPAQFLNTLFGNISIRAGVRLERFDLPAGGLPFAHGPRFGVAGLRRLAGVPDRPLLATALKPMGLPSAALAEQAYRLALGGLDLIKDDHGLADQPYAPFAERVPACIEAVERANRETGGRCLYAPNLSGSPEQVHAQAIDAVSWGAGALLVSPALLGFSALWALATAETINLPLLAHPTFMGSFTAAPDSGISHYCLYGQIMRVVGADASIFPNYGGRFAFTREACAAIAEGCAAPLGNIQAILPAPGGGMTLERVPELLAMYGRDVIFLIGGGLHRHSPDLTANARYFRSLIGG